MDAVVLVRSPGASPRPLRSVLGVRVRIESATVATCARAGVDFEALGIPTAPVD
jgi:hypothetical protein